MDYSEIPLPDILRIRSQEQGDALAFRFLADGTRDTSTDWTYGDLARHAGIVAAGLEGTGGRRVVLAVDPGLHYVAALFGIMGAGATAVPSFPPVGRRATDRFLSIIADCTPDVVLVSGWLRPEVDDLVRRLPPAARAVRWLFVDDDFFRGEEDPGAFPVRHSEPALLQYTSGSTGDPKGIVLTHENLVSNCQVLHHSMGPDSGRMGLSWLPPYHDMGLMGTIMLALHGGWPLVMMSPVHFVQQPVRWLRAVTDHQVTISVAPNFAFDMCVDSIEDDELEGLDLSTLRQLYCGAEPVLKTTLDRFRERFAPYGYREEALIPCYGMAEATLFVSGKPDGTMMRSAWLAKPALERGNVEPAEPGAENSTQVVSCGAVAVGHEVLIVDPETRTPLPEGRVGEIWVRGPNVAEGYYGKPEATAETFGVHPAGAPGGEDGREEDEGYLRTGDAGFLLDGEVYVTGRLKDVVIIAGRNLYPQDIEVSTLNAHDGLRRAAAFSVRPEGREEELVVVGEFRRAGRRTAADLAAVREAVVAAVTTDHAVRPARVHLGPPGTVPTTTSGKVRRRATREAFERGLLKELVPAPDGADAGTAELAAAGEAAG